MRHHHATLGAAKPHVDKTANRFSVTHCGVGRLGMALVVHICFAYRFSAERVSANFYDEFRQCQSYAVDMHPCCHAAREHCPSSAPQPGIRSLPYSSSSSTEFEPPAKREHWLTATVGHEPAYQSLWSFPTIDFNSALLIPLLILTRVCPRGTARATGEPPPASTHPKSTSVRASH